MKDRDKAEAIATERMQLIAPLLGEHVDAALARQLKATMSAQSGLSERTIRRYVARYQAEGFRGLLPASHPASDSPSGAIAPDILDQAIQLRREAPHRSVRQIIQVLEWEGRVTPGQIKRSTLQDQLTAHGYSARQMRLYSQAGVAARRFQRRHRNDLWQSDYSEVFIIPTFGDILPSHGILARMASTKVGIIGLLQAVKLTDDLIVSLPDGHWFGTCEGVVGAGGFLNGLPFHLSIGIGISHGGFELRMA